MWMLATHQGAYRNRAAAAVSTAGGFSTTRAAINTGSATMHCCACQRSTVWVLWFSASTSTPWRNSRIRSTVLPVCKRPPSGAARRWVSQPLPSGQVNTPSDSYASSPGAWKPWRLAK